MYFMLSICIGGLLWIYLYMKYQIYKENNLSLILLSEYKVKLKEMSDILFMQYGDNSYNKNDERFYSISEILSSARTHYKIYQDSAKKDVRPLKLDRLRKAINILDDGILKYDDVKRRQETIDNLLIDV